MQPPIPHSPTHHPLIPPPAMHPFISKTNLYTTYYIQHTLGIPMPVLPQMKHSAEILIPPGSPLSLVHSPVISLELDISNKYPTHHRPSPLLLMFLHVCPVSHPLKMESSLVCEQVLLPFILPVLPTTPFVYVNITSQRMQWSFHKSKHLSLTEKIHRGPG